MRSVSMSDPALSLLSVHDLCLSLDLEYFGRGGSWRDRFVSVFKGAAQGRVSSLRVLDQVRFAVNAGDRVGLIGRNGAGKSSLCRCVMGIMKPDAGKIDLQGRVRGVFDPTLAVNPELTGRENARIMARFYYPWVTDQKALIQEALEFSELGKFLDAPFKTYSNGMQARLCLSIVSAVATDLLILDEVFGGADLSFQKKITSRFMNLIQRSSALIFVSHQPDQIRDICNRLLILSGGKLVYDGGVEQGLAMYEGDSL